MFAFTEFLLYSKVGEHIGKHQPFYSIEPSPYETKEEIAAHYISEIKKIYPHGPYCLAGFCKWGDIAVEMAHRLVSQGDEVPLLILIEYYSLKALRSRLSPKFLGPKIKYFFNALSETNSYKEKGKLIVAEIVNVSQFIYDKLIGKYNDKGVDKKTYSGKVVLVKASDTYGFYDNCNMGWSETFIGEIENITIEGDHLNIMRNPAAAQLAEKLNAVLEKTNEKYNGKVG
ncbi:MAG: thioesterase domain-containing protein [Chitinophagaceae bacterium]